MSKEKNIIHLNYQGMSHKTIYQFPRDAVREAVFNAILHKFYPSSIPVQIRIEDDAMYISNDCVFPKDWTKETLMHRHNSRPYNPI